MKAETRLPRSAAIALLGLVLLSACASIPSRREPAGQCRTAEGVLSLTGATDQSMLDCVTASPPSPVVRIRSAGGNVATAMQIAERLDGMDATLVVHGYCESSCANYLLPVARRVVIEPGARIVLHGSIDDHILAKSGRRDLFDQQQAFVARHGIPLGWLLYRTEEEARARTNGRYVTGAERTPPGDPVIAYIIVEERFVRSCFPSADIEFQTPTYMEQLARDGRRRARLERDGFFPSGSLECASEPGIGY